MTIVGRFVEDGRTMERSARGEGELVQGGIVAGRCVRHGPEAARVVVGRQTPGAPPAQTPAGPQPEVKIIRSGDVIQAIEVICTCGQRIRVRYVYDTEEGSCDTTSGGEA